MAAMSPLRRAWLTWVRRASSQAYQGGTSAESSALMAASRSSRLFSLARVMGFRI